MSFLKSSESPALTAQPVPRRRLILVVDDSRLQRRILSKSLKRWGYEIIEAASGAEAIALCHEHRPELVISDWVMPGMTGLDFCREFKALTSETYGYFILLTSKSDSSEIAEGLEMDMGFNYLFY